jgi:RNA polymerase sigma-70 factor, ECF subfamily
MPLPRLVQPVTGALPDRSDDDLMTLAQAGMREAFAVLVERHATRLPNVGAELAQETWIAVWAERSRYRPEGKFVVWILTAARNRCRNHLRHRGVEKHNAQHWMRDHEPAPSLAQIDGLLVEERRRRVRGALARLPEKMREALLLRYAEELAYEEMVEILGATESTLRSRVHHGLRLLRSLLERKP